MCGGKQNSSFEKIVCEEILINVVCRLDFCAGSTRAHQGELRDFVTANASSGGGGEVLVRE